MNIDLFDFALPPELIAQRPLYEREKSRLLVANPGSPLIDDYFYDLARYFKANDVLVLNNTKVIKARLKGLKESGGKVEILVERIVDESRAYALIKASKAPQVGSSIILSDTVTARVASREDDLFLLQFAPHPLAQILEKLGSVPLPPYITRAPDARDDTEYQTIFAKNPGAVAAPTAGLHFTSELLTELKNLGVKVVEVTLHVGAGTFQPVRVQDTKDHLMHAEYYTIGKDAAAVINDAREKGQRITAVGTTSLRALESAAADGRLVKLAGDTRLFITPGYEFHIVDRLITNFHLPKSTLMMLVAAFSGLTEIKEIYAHAILHRYRFFSYGDAMLLTRKDGNNQD